MPLYQSRLRRLRDPANKPPVSVSVINPIVTKIKAIYRAFIAEILPDGIGRFLVLSIRASVFLS
jgi:hypothetical protein